MWEEIYDTYYKELLRYSCGACGDQAMAEDLVQETFVKAIQHTADFQDLGRNQKRAWLYRTLKNLLVDIYRRQQLEEAYAQGLERAQAEADEPGFQQTETRLLLLRIPEPDRTLFTLRYLKDYTAAELAELYHLPPGTVRAKLSRTRVQLKKMISEK